MAKTHDYAKGERVPGARAYQVRLHPELAGRAGTVTHVDIPVSDGGLPAVEVDWDGLGPREMRRSHLMKPTPSAP
jgi:hypothetical protein